MGGQGLDDKINVPSPLGQKSQAEMRRVDQKSTYIAAFVLSIADPNINFTIKLWQGGLKTLFCV